MESKEKTDTRKSESPERNEGETDVDRNKRLGEPIAHLRELIAYKWKIIVRLTKKLKIHPKKKKAESEKSASEIHYRNIKKGRASTATIRKEIGNILDQKIPNRRKGIHLKLLLEQCKKDVEEIMEKRNELRGANENLTHGFIHTPKYRSLVEKVRKKWGDDEPLQIAQAGLLRACETWDPAESLLSTWAYTCIQSLLKKAIEKRPGEKKMLSLDQRHGKDGADGLSFAETVEDEKASKDSHRRESRSGEISLLMRAFNELDPVHRRVLELTMGLNGTEIHDHPEQILNQEGYTTKNGRTFNPSKVKEYKKVALNALRKRLTNNE